MLKQSIKLVMGLMFISLSITPAYGAYDDVNGDLSTLTKTLESDEARAEIQSQCEAIKKVSKTGIYAASVTNLLDVWKFDLVMSYPAGAILTVLALWLVANAECDSPLNLSNIFPDGFFDEDVDDVVFFEKRNGGSI